MCPPGWVSETGLEPCFACPKGDFQEFPGKTYCMICPNDVLTRNQGSTALEDCLGISNYSIRSIKMAGTSELKMRTTDDCMKEPCRNNATCVAMRSGFTCNCLSGWTGKP